MSRIKIKKKIETIVRQYASKLKENNISFKYIYIFGSQVKGKTNKWSDIDVAIISDKFKKNRDRNEDSLWHLRRKVDSRIEPHGLTMEDFKNDCDPMVYEIKKTGIKVI